MLAKALTLLALSIFVPSDAAGEISALRSALFSNYDEKSKPDGQTNVGVRLTVIDLGLCPHKQLFSVDGWLAMAWDEPRLKWDPKEFGGIDRIRVPHSDVWIPDITPYVAKTKVGVNFPEYLEPKAIIFSSGKAVFVPPISFKLPCKVNYEGLPFSIQNCTIKMGSWTHDKSLINLDVLGATSVEIVEGVSSTKAVDVTEFTNENVEILGSTQVVESKLYESDPGHTYTSMTVSIAFRRNAVFMDNHLINADHMKKEHEHDHHHGDHGHEHGHHGHEDGHGHHGGGSSSSEESEEDHEHEGSTSEGR